MAAETCIECDVAIVGAGFAGALIANELGKARKKVVILEASRTTPSRMDVWSAKILIPIFVVSFSGNTTRAATATDARTTRFY
jgi:2-polyprenyl-6-methoxyphenol hydroxylase-like FAD-dependent oxidoreductase